MPRKNRQSRNEYNNEWLKKKRRGTKGDELRDYHKKYIKEWRKKKTYEGKRYWKTYQERLEYNREYNRKNAKLLSKKKRSYYLANKEYFSQYAKERYQKKREKILQEAREYRIEVVNAYGGKCVCCGEIQIEFLALDHKNNDGAKHRKKVGGSKMYRWAKQNNYPDILQVLCHNCNLAKAHHGICPHQKKKYTS